MKFSEKHLQKIKLYEDKLTSLESQLESHLQNNILESDDSLQEYFDAHSVNKFLSSRVYLGRRIGLIQVADGGVSISIYSKALHESLGDEYEPTILELSLESFILLLEFMAISVDKLGIDKSAILSKLTADKKSNQIEVENKVSLIGNFL